MPMNLVDILICALIAGACIAIVVREVKIRKRRKEETGCSGGCEFCSGCPCCGSKSLSTKKSK